MIRRMFYRLTQSVVTLLGVSLLVFFITHAIPADPVAAVAGPHADKETRDRIRDELAAAGIQIEDTPTGSHWILD